MKKFRHYFMGLGFVLFIFGIHMLPISDSMLNENNTKLSHSFLVSQIRYHQEFAPFARRPLTSGLIEFCSSIFGIPISESFVWVNLVLLLLSGLLVYQLSLKLKATTGQALFNMSSYFLTFSIVFAFFPPVFSYDEPLQYCFLFLSIWAVINNKWAYYCLCFFLALVARESSIFLFPGFILIGLGLKALPSFNWSPLAIRRWGLLFMPLSLYALYLILFFWKTGLWAESSTLEGNRLQCLNDNFGTLEKTLETLFSFLLVLVPALYFLFVTNKEKKFTTVQKRFVQAFLIGLLINTPVIMLATLARESRLFALPLIFLWPLAGQLFWKELTLLMRPDLYLEVFRSWPNRLYFLGLCILNYLISFKVYVPSFPAADNFFNEYLFIVFLLISVHFLLWKYLRNNPGTDNSPTEAVMNIKKR
ncbi:MAG TPA: hypothetical protein VLZ54_10515 [Arenibacter sp.]|nr:hypothetical protein [Arenibacter sp.]